MVDFGNIMSNLKHEFQKEVDLHGEKVSYTHKVSIRSRTMKLAIYHDGRFVVTTPRHVSEAAVNLFLIKKALWILSKITYFKHKPRVEVVTHSLAEINQYKKELQKILLVKLPFFAAYYNVIYKNVVIKNITSRWGSCSSKGNLNFNYKVVLLPEEFIDYIVVHELCHLLEMNHSKRFWNLVQEKIPHHKELRKQLKLYR